MLIVSPFVVRFALSTAAPTDEKERKPPVRSERPLPRLSGRTIDGGHAGTELFRNRRGVVYVFATTDRDAELVAGIVRRLEVSATKANIGFLGVNREGNPKLAVAFAKREGLRFPILADRSLSLSRKLQVPPGRSSVIVVDAAGYIVGGFAGLQGELSDLDQAYENELRRILHLQDIGGSVTPALGLMPQAPNFEVKSLDGEVMKLSELKGKVVVFVFFAPTCPHCHTTLQLLDGLPRRQPQPDQRSVRVSVSNRRYVLEDMVE
ncbi:MAG: redoxin family protein, partial [Deltaproteobacteria bacterium]|nr:redoxin family protein [Deltaproteobacteria bacterium]